MRRSNSAERIDAGGVDPRRDNLPEPPLFRVPDALAWLNANWTGAAERIVGNSVRQPRQIRPIWTLVVMVVALLAAGGIGVWHSYAKPRIERATVNLGERLAQAINIDCADAGSKRLPDDQPACR